jgi:hypothetical protein
MVLICSPQEWTLLTGMKVFGFLQDVETVDCVDIFFGLEGLCYV